VPGLRDELIAGLLRALPKAIRRHVVPAADWAARLGEELVGAGPESHEGLPKMTLRAALAARIQHVAHQSVTAADFEMDRVPAHLGMSFRAVDARGRTVGSSRDLAELQERLAGRARDSVARSLTAAPRGPRGAQPAAGGGDAHRTAPAPAPGSAPTGAGSLQERTGITTWDVGELPEVVDTKVAGGVVRGYPALVDDGASVSLRIEATAERAARLTPAGIRRLL